MKQIIQIIIFVGCIVFSSNAQIKNSLANFPFSSGSVKIVSYENVNPDTLFVFNDLKRGDTVSFTIDTKGSKHICVSFIAQSAIGEYNMSVNMIENASENQWFFLFNKRIQLLLKTNNAYNQKFQENVQAIDTLFASNIAEAINRIEQYKGEGMYFYFYMSVMPVLDEKYFNYIDTAYLFAIKGKPTYWKNTFTESYLDWKNLNAQIFNQENMHVLDRKLNKQNLLQQIDSSKRNVVYFWASWCAPCIAKLKSITSSRLDSINQNTNFILVSIDEDSIKWKKAVDKFSLNFNHFLAKDADLLTKRLLIFTIPQSIEINSQSLEIKRIDF